jgi:hypothetical protein
MPPDWLGQEITYDESCLCYNYNITIIKNGQNKRRGDNEKQKGR